MNINRQQFNLAVVTSLFGATGTAARAAAEAAGASTVDRATTPRAAGQASYFFKDSAFEYVLQNTLGRAFYQGGDVGRVLYLIRQIKDGDLDSAYGVLVAAGDEARSIAETSARGGHMESARQAYLWAQNFYDSAIYFADTPSETSRTSATWEMLDDCWLKSLPFFDTEVTQVAIPYEGVELRGFRLRGRSASRRRPLVIMVNGSDGSMLDMWMMGGAAAVARGYDCLVFDGPGQGYALWKQGLHFRPDWEKVITPVIDRAVRLEGVDPKRIAIQGISQGGYWVPRAAAFERRIAAVVADPGVVDVSTSWTATLPPPMLSLLRTGKKDAFDSYMDKSLDPGTKAALRFRMRPFGFTSYYDTFRATFDYSLAAIAERIRCPTLVTQPVNEAFWPGQSATLYASLTCPKTLARFTQASGGDLHCEPGARGLRDLRVFDWLDDTLGAVAN